MNFSTNQVLQFYDLTAPASGSSVITPVQLPDNSVQFIIERKDASGNVVSKETTDVIKALVGKMVADGDIVSASNDTKALKEMTVAVKSGLVAAGEEYIISLTFRGFGQEDVVIKTISARATNDTDTTLYAALLANALVQRKVEVDPLYDVLVKISSDYFVAVPEDTYPEFSTTTNYAAGDIVVYATDNKVYKFKTTHSAGDWSSSDVDATGEAEANSTTLASGFIIREAKPYWRLGSFPETLANIEVGVAPIIVSGVEYRDWLTAPKFADSSATLPNSHKMADLEYFCKGERGNSNGLANWPDNIAPELLVNANSSTGYSALTVHYAFVGANDEVQKCERDAIFVVDGTTTTKLAAIVDALDGTTFSGKPVPVIA